MVTRRHLIAALASAGSAGLAGCDGSDGGRSGSGADAESAGSSTARTTDGRSPSLPYAAADDAENVDRPLGIAVGNAGSDPRFLTVGVRHGDRTLFVDSRKYAAEGTDRTRYYPNLVARRGTYDVFAETADGATARGVLRVDGVHRDLRVELGGDLRIRQTARCTPDCGPVSLDGESTPFGNPRWPKIDAWTGYTVTVANVGRERRRIRVVFDVGEESSGGASAQSDDAAGETVLDYRYRPPPGTVLGFPTVPPFRRLRVTVETEENRWRGRLDADRSVTLPLAVDGDGPRVDGWPGAGADLRVRNERGPRVASVVLSRDGERVAAWSSDLSRGESTTVREFVPEPGLYEAELACTADGESHATTRSLVVTRRSVLLVHVRDGIDAVLVE